MASKRLGMLTAMIAALAIVAWLPVAPASAQGRHCAPQVVNDGEPTDPDGATPVFGEYQLKVGETYGLAETGPEEAAAPGWVEALLDLLRALHLLPAEEGKE